MVTLGNAIVSIDPASDKQAVVATDHDSRVLDQLAAQRGLAPVCVQPLLVSRACEAEDLTFDGPRRPDPWSR